jgi:hypothetical protein
MRTGLFVGALLAGTAMTTMFAEASHFRGAAMVPQVSASGLLTITTTSFWRPTSVSSVFAGVSGAAFISNAPQINDTTDTRFTKVTNVATYQLSGAGLYQIVGSSCCRVDGIQNFPGGNSSTSWTMNSAINWNGSSANAPILFNFSAIQPEVLRNANYSDSLGAVSGSGHTLTYNQALNGIPAQPPGFVVDPVTGQLTIPAASTATYADNDSGNDGADYAFSGNILSSDGSFVEFDWLFDAVNSTGNLAPDVDDAVINALVGSTVTHTVTGSDPNLDPLTWDLVSFSGACGGPFNFDPTTQDISWNTTGCGVGTYIANVRASDGSLTDVGTITINLTSDGTTPVFEPATLFSFGAGLVGLGLASRRRRRQA